MDVLPPPRYSVEYDASMVEIAAPMLARRLAVRSPAVRSLVVVSNIVGEIVSKVVRGVHSPITPTNAVVSLISALNGVKRQV